jgi:hypothetical protein
MCVTPYPMVVRQPHSNGPTMQCKAKAKSTGVQCTRRAVTGYEVCVVHGGKTPRGIASANTKHGRYSRDLPTRLLDRYEAAQKDPRLLELRDDISLLQARLSEVLSRVDDGESGQLWANLITAKAEYLAASGDDQPHKLWQLLAAIDAGANDYAAWSDVRSLLDQRRRLVESERKRIVELQQTISVERAMLLIGAISGILKARITDRHLLAQISQDIQALLNHGDTETHAVRSTEVEHVGA